MLILKRVAIAVGGVLSLVKNSNEPVETYKGLLLNINMSHKFIKPAVYLFID